MSSNSVTAQAGVAVVVVVTVIASRSNSNGQTRMASPAKQQRRCPLWLLPAVLAVTRMPQIPTPNTEDTKTMWLYGMRPCSSSNSKAASLPKDSDFCILTLRYPAPALDIG